MLLYGWGQLPAVRVDMKRPQRAGTAHSQHPLSSSCFHCRKSCRVATQARSVADPDGWGQRDDPTDNAIAQAHLPHWRGLLRSCPHTLIHTSGLRVGLPAGQMGNSEVGHMNLGAGRVVYQDLTRIDAAIADGSFFDNAELVAACQAAITNNGTLHLFGLLSPGGVHSHEDHIFAMLELVRRQGVPRIAVHAFLDGRDTPPRSAAPSIERLLEHCAKVPGAHVASVSGRYFAMDRDNRWERVEKAYLAIAEAQASARATDARSALEAAYAREENDEFVQPTVIDGARPMRDGDAVVFMNFRADRARQLSASFVQPEFSGFARPRAIALSRFVCLTEYDATCRRRSRSHRKTWSTPARSAGLAWSSQLRIAETEKYAHVTFFFQRRARTRWPGEERIRCRARTCPPRSEAGNERTGSHRQTGYDRTAALRRDHLQPRQPRHGRPHWQPVGRDSRRRSGRRCTRRADRGDPQGRWRMLVTADHGNLEMMRCGHRPPIPRTPPARCRWSSRPPGYAARRWRAQGCGADIAAPAGHRAAAGNDGHALVQFARRHPPPRRETCRGCRFSCIACCRRYAAAGVGGHCGGGRAFCARTETQRNWPNPAGNRRTHRAAPATDGERDSASRAARADQLVDQESRALRLIDEKSPVSWPRWRSCKPGVTVQPVLPRNANRSPRCCVRPTRWANTSSSNCCWRRTASMRWHGCRAISANSSTDHAHRFLLEELDELPRSCASCTP